MNRDMLKGAGLCLAALLLPAAALAVSRHQPPSPPITERPVMPDRMPEGELDRAAWEIRMKTRALGVPTPAFAERGAKFAAHSAEIYATRSELREGARSSVWPLYDPDITVALDPDPAR